LQTEIIWPQTYNLICHFTYSLLLHYIEKCNHMATLLHSNYWIQELSYRKQIARKLRTQYIENISVTLKSRLRVTQDHWKRNHWVDHTRLTINRVIWRWILSWPWKVGQRSLKVIEIGAIWKLGCGFLLAFDSNHGRTCSRLWDLMKIKQWHDIQCQWMAWPWKPG